MATIREPSGAGTVGGSGWVYVADVVTQGSGTVTDKVWQDGPNNTILQSFTASDPALRFSIRASYPTVQVGGVPATLVRDGTGGHYVGDVDVTVAGDGDVVARVFNGDGVEGDTDTTSVTLDLPPTITALSFTGGYPGSQTELKAGDTFQLTGTCDKPADRVEVFDYEACANSVTVIPTGTTFTVTGTIADRGDTAVLRPARVRVRSASNGAYGPTRDTNQLGGTVDGTDLVNCNDLRPIVSIGAITYPGSQQALKGSETATVVNTAIVGSYDTIIYDSPNTQLLISNATTFEDPKTVTRIDGDYNVTVANFRITANRAANDATTIDSEVVNIANVAVIVSVVPPAARLRSGGNDGTSAQNHTITVSGDQQLLNAPSLDPGAGSAGVFVGSWSGGGTTWTRALQVHDDDDKGTKSWQNLVATNLAGLVTNTISSGATYVLGGFVARSLTFGPFLQSTTLNVAVVTYTKLSAGVFTATDQPAQLNPTQGDTSDIVDTYTILSPLGTNPQTLWWNDVAAASSNSSGTAQITNLQELV